jgi:hypothetical protein
MNRCEVCDRPVAVLDEHRAHLASCGKASCDYRTDLCWGFDQCEAARVDWRARAMGLDRLLSEERMSSARVARVALDAQDDLAAARERIGELVDKAACVVEAGIEAQRERIGRGR